MRPSSMWLCPRIDKIRRASSTTFKWKLLLQLDRLLPTPPQTRRMKTGSQLKTWATTIKEDLEPPSWPRVFGFARWRKGRVKVPSELAQDRRAWRSSPCDVVNSIGDVSSTRPGESRRKYNQVSVPAQYKRPLMPARVLSIDSCAYVISLHGPSERRVPPAPIKKPEWSSRLRGQRKILSTQPHGTTEHERHLAIWFRSLYFP